MEEVDDSTNEENIDPEKTQESTKRLGNDANINDLKKRKVAEPANELDINEPPTNLPNTTTTTTVAAQEPLCEKPSTSAAAATKKSNDYSITLSTKNRSAKKSPKKRLDVDSQADKKSKNKQGYIYGNYLKYYGYRTSPEQGHDIRLEAFDIYKDIFNQAIVLDIGCNIGMITAQIANRYPIKKITGLDIDRSLINMAIKKLNKQKKTFPQNEPKVTHQRFPFNINFVHGNYILRDDILLEIEEGKFDVILCLSVTKWIQLNFGDKGLKQAFRRMFLQLKSGGKLVLEYQPFNTYARRKNMNETFRANYKAIKLFPKDFVDYLLSLEIGFNGVTLMAVPDHWATGFRRPIYIFYKD